MASSYYARNRTVVLEKMKKKYADDPEFRTRAKAYVRARHRRLMVGDKDYRAKRLQGIERLRAKFGRKCSVESIRRTRNKANARIRKALHARIVAGLGGQCVCCGISEPKFLTLDHIRRDGAAHRRRIGSLIGSRKIYLDVIREGFPADNYRLFCMNCNWATRTGEPCPHRRVYYSVAI